MLPERARKSTCFTSCSDRNTEVAAYYREIAANGSKILVLSAVGNFLQSEVSAVAFTGRSGLQRLCCKVFLLDTTIELGSVDEKSRVK